jgi:hypothetical protein
MRDYLLLLLLLLPGMGLAFKDRVGNVPELCALYVHGQFTLKV